MQQLEGYVMALMGAYVLVGRLRPGDNGGQKLEPVYELHIEYVSDGGNFGILRTCLPVLGSVSIKEMPLPDGAIIVPCSDMSAKEREALSNAMQTCDKMKQAMRAAEAGIVTAASMPKPGLELVKP